MIAIALPRSRDFRGLSFKSFDGKGNYNYGINEQIIFTEINYDKIESIRGLNITLVTSANTDDEAYWLLKELGLPLRDKQNVKRNILLGKKIVVLNADVPMAICVVLVSVAYVFVKWRSKGKSLV